MSQGAVFSWYSSNTKTSYPFDERQADGLHELFVDAYVTHTKLRDKQQRLRLSYFDPAGLVELKFEDGTLLASLTGADNFSSYTYGAYTVYEWRRHTTTGPGFTDEDIVVRLVVLTEALANFTFPVLSTTAYLLASLVDPKPSLIRRIAVALPGLPCCTGGGISDKPVILEAGNNVSIELAQEAETAGLGLEEVSESRVPTTVVLNATAGEGTGRFPTCASLEPAIRRVGQVGADSNGNLQLMANDCLWSEMRLSGPVLPPIHVNTDYLGSLLEAALQLHESCRACCSCDDYGNTYTNLKRWWDRGVAVGARFERLRLRYNELCQATADLKAAKETGIQVRIRAVARPDFHLALSAIVMNNSAVSLGSITLQFTLDRPGVYTEKSGHLEAENLHNVQLDPVVGGGDTTFTVVLGSLRPAHYAVYSFGVRFAAGTPRAGAVVRPRVDATHGITTVTDQKSVSLRGPLEKS